jgi:hypothetical protein
MGWRTWAEERQPHRRHLLPLRHNDLLGEAPEVFVLAVPELCLRHIDRALVMRGHHRDEVSVNITGRLDRHAVHHGVHRRIDVGDERRFVGPRRSVGKRAGDCGSRDDKSRNGHTDRPSLPPRKCGIHDPPP